MTEARPTPAEGERPEGKPTAESFARWLLQERALRGLTREQVGASTHLGSAMIAALESGDPQRMPPRAYTSAYLRTYAAVVGLDPDDLVLRWQEVAGPEDARPRRRRFPVSALAAAIAIVLLAILAWFGLFGSPRERRPLRLDHPRAVQRAPYGSEPGR